MAPKAAKFGENLPISLLFPDILARIFAQRRSLVTKVIGDAGKRQPSRDCSISQG